MLAEHVIYTCIPSGIWIPGQVNSVYNAIMMVTLVLYVDYVLNHLICLYIQGLR